MVKGYQRDVLINILSDFETFGSVTEIIVFLRFGPIVPHMELIMTLSYPYLMEITWVEFALHVTLSKIHISTFLMLLTSLTQSTLSILNFIPLKYGLSFESNIPASTRLF